MPIWFWWDGEALLVFSKPGAQKVRNLRAHPSVMLALLDKYAGKLALIGLNADEYAATYSQVIRIMPDDFLPWHGRTSPQSFRVAGAPARSIDEPRRPGTGSDGEPSRTASSTLRATHRRATTRSVVA